MRRAASVSLVAVTAVVCAHACLDVAKLETEADAGADAATDAGADAPVDASGPGVELLSPSIPQRPAGNATPSGKGAMRWFAARRIFAGTVDPETLTADANGWRRIGLDVDGECTTAQQSEADTSSICLRPQGASSDTLTDADECRDNAFGRILSSGTQTLASGWEADYHAAVANGFPTMLLRLSDLDVGSDDPYVPGAVFVTAETDSTPAWDGSDVFAVQSNSVLGPSITDPPSMTFPKGYLAGNVWVSGEPGTSVGQYPVLLIDNLLLSSVDAAVLMVALDPAHQTARGSVMGGAISRSAVLSDWAPYFEDVTGCNPLLLDILMKQFLLPAMDLGSQPPTFQTPGQECQSMSIGMVYEWVPVKAPVEVVDAKPPFTPCDAG